MPKLNTLWISLVQVGKSIWFYILSALILYFALRNYASFGNMPDSLQTLSALVSGELLFNSDYPLGWIALIKSLLASTAVVFLALVWSTTFSVLAGYALSAKPHGRFWDAVLGFFTLYSGVPVFILGLALFTYKVKTGNISSRLDTMLMGSFVLGTAEGALTDWIRYFRSAFTDLRETTFFKASQSRGQSNFRMVYRSLIPFLRRGLASRITVMFGGLIVLERLAREDRGIGYQFLEYVLVPELPLAFAKAYAAGLLIMLVPAVVQVFTILMFMAKSRRANLSAST